MEDLEKQIYIAIVTTLKNAGILRWDTLKWIDDYADHAKGGLLDVYSTALNVEYLEQKEREELLKFRSLNDEQQKSINQIMDLLIKKNEKYKIQ